MDRSDVGDKDRWRSVYSSTVLIFPMSPIKLGSPSSSLQRCSARPRTARAH